MNIHSLPLHLRPREKLLEKGPQALKDNELLAILLRTGTKSKNAIQLAETILCRHEIEKLPLSHIADLITIKGVEKTKAVTIIAAFELARRAFHKEVNILPFIETPADVSDQCIEIAHLKKEHFLLLCLDARNRLVHKETVSIGTLNASLVHPREVFVPALLHHSVTLILVHNHPSGVLEPSDADIALTKRIMSAGELLGIAIADHVIVSEQGCLSMKEAGMI